MFIVYVALLGVIAACSPGHDNAADGADASALASIDISALANDGELQLETDRYSMTLRLPVSANPNVRTDMQSFLQTQVDDFLESVREEPEPGYFGTHQYELTSNWEVAESDYLYTFIVRGHVYTGGAHSMPFLQTFSYLKSNDESSNNKQVPLEQLLQGDDALAVISVAAKAHF